MENEKSCLIIIKPLVFSQYIFDYTKDIIVNPTKVEVDVQCMISFDKGAKGTLQVKCTFVYHNTFIRHAWSGVLGAYNLEVINGELYNEETDWLPFIHPIKETVEYLEMKTIKDSEILFLKLSKINFKANDAEERASKLKANLSELVQRVIQSNDFPL